jgi:shikimate kinase
MEPRVTGAGRNANLILVGFMGTGKSSVGRRVAARLGREFFDFDTALEARFGRPVARIFAEEGAAVFRAAEADLCRSLPLDAGLVVATGGGVVVPPANREALHARGIVVCLIGDPATLTARLLAEGHAKRPMLGDAPEAAVTRLLAARAAAYAAIPLQVDTTGLDVDAVAERVLAVYAAQVKERETP